MGNGGSGARAQGLAAQRKSGAGASGAGGSGAGASTRLPEAQPGQELKAQQIDATRRFNPYLKLDAQQLVKDYGEHQLGLALQGYSKGTLEEAAKGVEASNPGLHISRASKAAMVSGITKAVTQGRYSANFAKAATASKPAGGKAAGPKAPPSAKSQRAAAAKAERAATMKAAEHLAPVRQMAPEELQAWGVRRFTPSATVNPYFLHAQYGAGQLRTALAGMSISHLKGASTVVQHFNPGTKPKSAGTIKGQIDYIVSHVTSGAQPAPFNASDLGL